MICLLFLNSVICIAICNHFIEQINMDNISDATLDCTENVSVVAEDCNRADEDTNNEISSLNKIQLRNFRLNQDNKR